MDCPQWFDPHIRKVIDLFSHPVWFITLIPDTTCSCVNHTTKTPQLDCPLCLGTGKKVSLTKVYASNQNTTNSYRADQIGFGEKNIVNVYYTKQQTDIKAGDFVLDKNCLDIVTDVYYERSDDNKIVYWRIETVPKKNYPEIFKKTFYEVLRKAGYDDK